MPPRPDYAAWLTPERLAVEEALWTAAATASWPYFVAALADAVPGGLTRLPSVLEWGCGTGLVPAALPPALDYLGVDSNPGCLARAVRRNPRRTFLLGDVRTVVLPRADWDVTCAFAFLKHFAWAEWAAIVARVLAPGRYGVFTMPVGPMVVDTGVEFAHLWVDPRTLQTVVAGAGHTIRSCTVLPGGESMVTTERQP